ncbi:hypothetical protein GCM10027053_00380 [Intrasporangium mesophilum]
MPSNSTVPNWLSPPAIWVPCIIGADEDDEEVVDESWVIEVALAAGVEGWFIDSLVLEPAPEGALFAVVPQPPSSRPRRPMQMNVARVARR